MTAPVAANSSPLADIRRLLGDRYAIERELGRGGMGTVYLARDLTLDRQVALKVLPPEFATDPSLRERFLRETRTAASFSHPNIVPVHAVEERDGVLAMAMGFVEGESLAERVKRIGPQSARDIVRLLQDVGYALAYAHGRGVVHRDIKPDNIMIERATGRALLMDFGISRAIGAPVGGHGLTRVGEVVGTPEYMSPEQASGDSVDGRSDLYSLGLVAWFAATGEVAMTGDSTQKILVRQLTEPVPSLASRRGDLAPALLAAVDRCVAKEPAERFGSAESLVDAIDAAQLAAPEVPLPIRVFVTELETVALVSFFLLLVGWTFLSRLMMRGADDLDVLLPVILLGAIAVGRYMQTFWDARRLALMGFSPDEVIAGLRRVFDERAEIRAQFRADPEMRRRRRFTVRMAVMQVVMAIVLGAWAYSLRIPNPDGGYSSPPGARIMIVSAMILIGLGLVLLAKSPLRAPPTERLFRRIWLGAFGRGFLTVAANRELKSRSTTTLTRSGPRTASTPPPAARTPAPVAAQQPPVALTAPTAPPAPPAAPRGDDGVRPLPANTPAIDGAADRLAEVERRLSALERWRDEFTP